MKNYILYKCQNCGCEFGLEKEYAKRAIKNNWYVGCPIQNHANVNVIGTYDKMGECFMNIKKNKMIE